MILEEWALVHISVYLNTYTYLTKKRNDSELDYIYIINKQFMIAISEQFMIVIKEQFMIVINKQFSI